MSRTPLRPRVVVSKCLGFEACRYNAQVIRDDFLKSLEPHVEYIFVCPEVEIGLGIPRDPVRLVQSRQSGLRLIQPSTDLDLTERMHRFNSSFLASLPEVEGFVLKSASPSCGIQDAKFYGKREASPVLGKGPGVFAQAVLNRYSYLAVEDEGRLKNLRIREHFLSKLFTLARWRRLREAPSRGKLVEFQASHKLLLMAYHQTQMRRLGRIAAGAKQRERSQVLKDYEDALCRAMAHLPRFKSHINVLMHAFGYVSKRLTGQERSYFLDMLQEYGSRRLPLSAPLGVLRAWLIRFEVDYLLGQVYFEPFPAELVNMADSGKGRGVSRQDAKTQRTQD